jgi:hypothetical protein
MIGKGLAKAGLNELAEFPTCGDLYQQRTPLR